MDVELSCLSCGNRFQAPRQIPGAAALERMIHEGAWFILADGGTFAEMIRAARQTRGLIRCGECFAAVAVRDAGTVSEKFSCC